MQVARLMRSLVVSHITLLYSTYQGAGHLHSIMLRRSIQTHDGIYIDISA